MRSYLVFVDFCLYVCMCVLIIFVHFAWWIMLVLDCRYSEYWNILVTSDPMLMGA